MLAIYNLYNLYNIYIQSVHSGSPFMIYTFYSSSTKERAGTLYLPLKPKGFSSCLVAFCIVSKHISRNSGLPGGVVASFLRFLGVPVFGAETGGCTPFWQMPFTKCSTGKVGWEQFLTRDDPGGAHPRYSTAVCLVTGKNHRKVRFRRPWTSSPWGRTNQV